MMNKSGQGGIADTLTLNINELQKMVEWYKIHLSPQTRV